MFGLLDEEVTAVLCGWCGHEHPADHDCGCKPCEWCDEYHDAPHC